MPESAVGLTTQLPIPTSLKPVQPATDCRAILSLISQEQEAGGVPGHRANGRANLRERHRYGFKINEATGAGVAARGAGGVYMRVQARGRRVCSGAVSIAGRGERRGAGARRQSARGPRPRGRGKSQCRSTAGVCERAECGGGEPRAARARADGRARSAPPLRAAPALRRARSLPGHSAPPVPKLRPVFLWARQSDGTVQEVRCEDYDSRNRIRIARTANGWRVIPRTEIYNSIRVPPLPQREKRDRRRRRRYGKSKRRKADQQASTWLAPDLESHIPSHTIAVPRVPTPPTPRVPTPPTPTPAEPTPLDNLLAVAELEFNQQRSELLDLDAGGTLHAFLPTDEVARDVMSFELGDHKPPDEMYFESKTSERPEETAFQNEMSVHKDLFDTISEAHYLPELSGPHDELLDSLVEKGCEDNQILGQALDKLAHLVHAAPDYTEEEDDMLLGGAPVADIIDRLEHELESPGRSSMSAAQGLLHLHHLTANLPSDHQSSGDQPYVSDEVFTQQTPIQCALDSLNSHSESNQVNHVEYGNSAEKRLQDSGETTNVMYTETVPDTIDYNKSFEQQSTPLPDQSEQPAPSQTLCSDNTEINDNCNVKVEEPQMETNEQEMAESMESTDFQDGKQSPRNENSSEPTDLSIKHVEDGNTPVMASAAETTNTMEDNLSEKSDEQPKDLSVHRRLPTPHASPRRTDVPRAPSRESDAMQSPQPSGIPAVPSSPEIFTMPLTKSKQTLFLETLLSSPSPKMYTSEVTITKQQCEPLNLGKHRKSASPTVSSCSDEIRKLNKDYGEPHEKRIKRESTEDIVKITKVFSKCSEDVSDSKKKSEKSTHKSSDETSPLKQLQVLKLSPDFNIPDPLLVPKDKLNNILANPGREIPALLIQRPELRLPEAFAFPAILQDPDILVISLSQLENILENDAKKQQSPKIKESKSAPPKVSTNSEQSRASTNTPQSETTTSSSQPKPIPSMDALAGDIDAATSAALNQMLWLPYLSQLEAMAACSQNMDFLKALNNSGYNGPNYPDLSQMFNPSARFPMGPSGFPMMPPMDYENRLQFAMWQEAMNHANATASQRKQAQAQAQAQANASTLEAQMKDLASKSSDVQNPYVHSTKNHQSKPHSSARTSPIAHNYNNSQRSMNHNPFLQSMYPGMNPNIRPNMPLPGLQIPYFNPNMMSSSQRSPRTGQQKSPTSPYYPNNNYLQSVKQSEGHHGHQRSNSSSSQESPRPRISVKSLQNLLEPNAAGVSGMRRNSNPSASLGRRREEPEVGSTTPGEPPSHLQHPHPHPHPHDPSSFHLWHPLFGNQKGYASPWSWTQVTATGD